MSIFNPYKSKSDEALMLLFQEGKHRAFEELYRRYSQRLLHFIYRMLNHREDLAQDVLQDVFSKLAEQPALFDTARSFKPWIFTVTANQCRKQFTKHDFVDAELVESEMPFESTRIEALLDGERFKKALKQELTLLKYEHRCTFILRFQEHLSILEISEVMDCSQGTVKSRIHYTLKHLSTRLKAFSPVNS